MLCIVLYGVGAFLRRQESTFFTFAFLLRLWRISASLQFLLPFNPFTNSPLQTSAQPFLFSCAFCLARRACVPSRQVPIAFFPFKFTPAFHPFTIHHWPLTKNSTQTYLSRQTKSRSEAKIRRSFQHRRTNSELLFTFPRASCLLYFLCAYVPLLLCACVRLLHGKAMQ